MNDHTRCEAIRMCLAEAGLDPDRMMCSDDGQCVVGFGTGNEGFPIEEVERLCDAAIAISDRGRSKYHRWPPPAPSLYDPPAPPTEPIERCEHDACPDDACEVHGVRPVAAAPPTEPTVAHQRPHSRACGWRSHPHGPDCHPNCPTCGGRPVAAAPPTEPTERCVFCREPRSAHPRPSHLFTPAARPVAPLPAAGPEETNP